MRNEYAHNRLVMWALWWSRNHSSGGNYATTKLGERVDGQGWDAPTVITNIDAEAEETERAVQSLEQGLQRVVREFYIGGGSAARKAKRLGLAESTMYARIEQATHAVARWLDDAQRAATVERARVEALQRATAKARTSEPTAAQRPTPAKPHDSTGSKLAAHLARIRAQRGMDVGFTT